MNHFNDKSFFASENTTNGFRNDFQKIFNPLSLEAIYIMKGGPGTGKSSFMREIANYGEENGFTVERFYCSSDPLSLDGIILQEAKIAIIDGTSPHTTDPNFPGVIENIINLGSFWDVKKLSEHKKEIIHLIKEKSKFYKRAYQFLAAYGEIAKEILSSAKSNLNFSKMQQNIDRQKDKVFSKNCETRIEPQSRNIATFSAEGYIETASYKLNAKKIWVIEDYLFSGHLYLNSLFEKALEQNQNLWKSTSPILPEFPNALYFPDTKCAFILGERNYDEEIRDKEYHYINMKRFLDMDSLKESKQKNKFGLKCIDMLLDGATEAFFGAKENHKKLESYYINAMNFDRLDKIKKNVISSIAMKK